MRIAFMADIHGNREALDACLLHAGRVGFDRLVFLGDLVGYGADPVYVVDRIAELADKGAIVLLGNHDEAAVSGETEGMNEYARQSILWTHDELDDAQRGFLAGLPSSVTEEDRLYVHSEATAPRAWHYVTNAAEAERSMRATDKRLTFCGHTHRPQLYHMASMKPAVHFKPPSAQPIPLIGNRKWLSVQGAVGQPRDENPAASWGLLDTGSVEFTYMRAPYDIEAAAGKIHAAHLPQILAARLYIGR
ncbi:MAG: metallophosphoesterase [Hyphomicrobiales bacterium]|nr:metallophosphoesterase [Hyphomicrobiales bacterium]